MAGCAAPPLRPRPPPSLSLCIYLSPIPSISPPSIHLVASWMMALVCVQAQHVAGLPAAAEDRQVLLCLIQQQQVAAVAAATCRGGVAAFHDQVLLLDCAPVSSSVSSAVAVAVTVDDTRAAVDVNLAEQLRRPSPRVVRFVLGGGAGTSTAGAVLCLTLHHRLMTRRRSAGGCTAALLSCLQVSLPPAPGGPPEEAGGNGMDDDDESSGFITIEKGTISRRRPPSDNLVTTDDEGPSSVKEEDSKVVDAFLAMLEGDGLDLDALIKDAEAELAGPPGRCPRPHDKSQSCS
ncbi:hypothetical protein C2845_PM09G24620 [Panicum miliaceum]|uniref:Uncharacterized protein n=1 Tax=Panicum miliaceum TaxID=4540 RepID=A0A3L6RXQ3_PANMI|nr:hypothetical protein C2845_PM09G24620 [Panicum miliaceum]